MTMKNDTIVAISTALGASAINIIRMSGDAAFTILKKIFSNQNFITAPSHTIHYGKIKDNHQTIDEVLVSIFKSPKTFTREDIVEINCHGGAFVAQKILEVCLKNGARLAEKGEFTERAYLNGRIDLTQAESIMDIIESRSNLSLRLANEGLDGKIYTKITELRKNLLDVIAHIEVNIDYPEYDDIEELTTQIVIPKIENLQSKISVLLDTAHDGKIIREGIKTAIIGRPNVGKSSLLNALLGEDKAIVTEIQGTTRDTVEGSLVLGGIVLHLIDTAGIRESEDIVEKIGIKKAKEVLNEAELVLFVINNNEPLTQDDKQLLKLTENKKRIIIINKIDLESKLTETLENSVAISALNKTNLEQLEQKIKNIVLSNTLNLDQQIYLSNTRHIAKIRETKDALEDALNSAIQLLPIDMVEIDLKRAWELLGDIIGDTKSTTLLDELFSKFCLGK